MECKDNMKDIALKLISNADGNVSMTKFLAFFGYFIFAIGSLYLLINNICWDNYSIFASYTGGGGAVLQFADKFIDSKYNSMPGSFTSSYNSYQQQSFISNNTTNKTQNNIIRSNEINDKK